MLSEVLHSTQFSQRGILGFSEEKEIGDMNLRTDYIKEELEQKYGRQTKEQDDSLARLQEELLQKEQENEKLRQYFIDHKIAMPK